MRYFYTPDSPQPPASPMLQEYMRENNIGRAMPFEAAREWYDGIRKALDGKRRGEYGNG